MVVDRLRRVAHSLALDRWLDFVDEELLWDRVVGVEVWWVAARCLGLRVVMVWVLEGVGVRG